MRLGAVVKHYWVLYPNPEPTLSLFYQTLGKFVNAVGMTRADRCHIDKFSFDKLYPVIRMKRAAFDMAMKLRHRPAVRLRGASGSR